MANAHALSSRSHAFLHERRRAVERQPAKRVFAKKFEYNRNTREKNRHCDR